MKKYEIGFIIQPNLAEDKTKELINNLKNIYLDAKCEVIDEADLGIKELAYEIKKHKSGYYFFFVVKANSELNLEFERICRINEHVIRYLIINIDKVEGSTLDVLKK